MKKNISMFIMLVVCFMSCTNQKSQKMDCNHSECSCMHQCECSEKCPCKSNK